MRGEKKRHGIWEEDGMERYGKPSRGSCRGVGASLVVRHASEISLLARAGDDGVRHFGGRAGGHRHLGHIGVSAKASGALGRYRQRDKRFIGDWTCSGQATVEYVVVLAGLLCVIAGLGALLDAFDSGLVVRHALAAASHHAWQGSGWLLDALAF